MKMKKTGFFWDDQAYNKITNVQKREKEREREREVISSHCVFWSFCPMITCYRGDVEARVAIVSAMRHLRKEVHNSVTCKLKLVCQSALQGKIKFICLKQTFYLFGIFYKKLCMPWLNFWIVSTLFGGVD